MLRILVKGFAREHMSPFPSMRLIAFVKEMSQPSAPLQSAHMYHPGNMSRQESICFLKLHMWLLSFNRIEALGSLGRLEPKIGSTGHHQDI